MMLASSDTLGFSTDFGALDAFRAASGSRIRGQPVPVHPDDREPVNLTDAGGAPTLKPWPPTPYDKSQEA